MNMHGTLTRTPIENMFEQTMAHAHEPAETVWKVSTLRKHIPEPDKQEADSVDTLLDE